MTEVLTYEALKADRDAQQKRADALAVENAALIEGLRCIYTTALIAQDSGPEILYSWDFANQPAEEIEMWISDAKETDAALAAIEARGVDQLIERKLKQLANMHPDTHAFGATAMSLRAQINELQAFAIELREAK